MIITLISFAVLVAVFAALAALALRHGVDSRTDPRGSLVWSAHRDAARGFWR